MLALRAPKAEPRITEAFCTGAGLGWHEHDEDVVFGCEQFFRPGHSDNLVPLDRGTGLVMGPGRRLAGRRTATSSFTAG